MAGKITRRNFLATATAATVASYAGEHLGMAAEPAAGRMLESTLAPSSSGRSTNVARNRAVYQSSSVDDNHTGHLVTDGSALTYWKCKPEGEQWISVDLGRAVSLGSAIYPLGRVSRACVPRRDLHGSQGARPLGCGLQHRGGEGRRRRAAVEVRGRTTYPVDWRCW